MSSTRTLTTWTEANRALGISPIDHLYNKMAGTYGDRFKRGFSSEAEIANWKDIWVEGLVDEKVTFDEVRSGLAAMRRMYDWPPTLPEFIKACRPTLDYEAAFIEAVTQMQNRRHTRRDADGSLMRSDIWSSPTIYWAAVKLGGDINVYPYQAIKGRWRVALDEAIREARTEIPAPMPALPAPGSIATSKERAHQRIAELTKMIRTKEARRDD